MEKQKTRVEGIVTSISKKEKGLISLVINDEKSEKEVDFPFGGNGLGLIPLQLALLNKRVRYELESILYEEPMGSMISSDLHRIYTLKILDGPLKDQIYKEET